MNSRRYTVPVAWVTSIALAGSLGFIAAKASFSPPQVDTSSELTKTIKVTEESIGEYRNFYLSPTWQTEPLGVSPSEGVLTSISISSGQEVSAGDLIYTTNLRATVIAKGQVPAFRDLTLGTIGADVTQLQDFLNETGHLNGKFKKGEFDAATENAVKKWQKTLNQATDGIVLTGDLLFVPSLPTKIAFDPAEVFVGKRLNAGETLFESLSANPTFSVFQSETQDPITDMVVTFNEREIPAIVEQTIKDPTRPGNVEYRIVQADGTTPICAPECDQIPLDTTGYLITGKKVIVPEQTGPAVPQAAIQTDASGKTFVVDNDSNRIEVKVLAQGDGLAIVDGIDIGREIQLTNTTESAQEK